MIRSLHFLFLLVSISFATAAQDTTDFHHAFRKDPSISVRSVTNKTYKQFVQLNIRQRVDHTGIDTTTFIQRVLVGVNDVAAPVTCVTEGYNIGSGFQPEWISEPASLLNSSIVIIEQRYTGQSLLKDSLYRFLNMRQIAADCHYIHSLLSTVLKGKWIATGNSKGGQASLAFMMYHPEDVQGAIVYGTPVRGEMNDGRINEFMHSKGTEPCGQKLLAVQQTLFQNKKTLTTMVEADVAAQALSFSMPFNVLTDHLLLELPVSFWQQCHPCSSIPEHTASLKEMYSFLLKVVPLKFYSRENNRKLGHAYYLAAHELGYYEYEKGGFSKFLSKPDISVLDLAPPDVRFNSSFMEQVHSFIQAKKDRLIFVYGENDPYGALKPEIANVVIVPGKCHQASLSSLPSKEERKVRTMLNQLVN